MSIIRRITYSGWLPAIGLTLAVLVFSGCARSPQAREAKFLEAGKKYLEKKDYSRAILYFRNAIRENATDAEPYYQLGLAYLETGDGLRAASAFKDAVELNPKHAAAQVKFAELLRASGEPKNVTAARERLDSVLRGAPDNTDALNALAQIEWRLGKPEDAQQHLERAIQAMPDNPETAVLLAQVQMAKNDLRSAEEILKKVASQKPPSAAAITALAAFYVRVNRTAEAEQQFRRAIQIDPANALALYDLANLLSRAGKADEAERVYRQLSQVPDKRYKPVHAIFLLNSGKTQEAVAEFEKIWKNNPRDRTARTMLLQAYWKANRPADGEKLLAQALRDNPKDTDALTLRSAIYMQTGKLNDAQHDLNQVLRIKPDSAEAHYMTSRIYQARGATLTQRQELAETLKLKPDFLQARLELARILIAAKAPKAALDVIKDTPPIQAKSLPVIVQKNWALVALGNHAQLKEGVEEGLALARTPELLLQDAIVKLTAQNSAGARASLDEVLKQYPEDVRALDLLVVSYRLQKQLPAVLPRLREHAAKHPGSAPIQTVLGDCYLAIGDRAQARTAFANGYRLNAKYTPAALALANLDIGEGKLDDARTTLSALRAADPGNKTALFLLASLEDRAGNRSKALELYSLLLEVDPSNVLVLNNLAFLLADYANKPDEALKHAERAKELSPENPEIEDTLGWVLYRKGAYDLAIRHLEAAVAKGSTAQRNYHLAMAHFKLGNGKRAGQLLQAALRQNPNLPEAKMALDVQSKADAVRKP